MSIAELLEFRRTQQIADIGDAAVRYVAASRLLEALEVISSADVVSPGGMTG